MSRKLRIGLLILMLLVGLAALGIVVFNPILALAIAPNSDFGGY